MTKNELVQTALGKTENPQILINMVSKRVRQLGQGLRPLIQVGPRMTFMDVALQEIADGKLTYKYLDEENQVPQEPVI
ncbi:MAG: DNA-directed RNA polymerase subunit omega [Verrucomicrobiales bacterium]|jgi:DNA-directed RNA polymerase subunit omega|nr:DNA-directed RNA polymerase subunit omega [Verrucomicrobiales bacterium]